MKSRLAQADGPLIDSLNQAAVESTVAGLKPFFKRSRWLGKHNRYASKAAERLTRDYEQNTINDRHLAQYIAASSMLHTNDGWSYLGRSVSSLLAGDPHRALHLAYYAELRAAMALLASTGVGVFNHRHATITATNSITKLGTKQGTHSVAWLALERWAQGAGSGKLLSSLITAEGLSLEEWFYPIGGSSSLAPQAQTWFMQWGMDLKYAVKDRAARNESSYRPDGVPDVAHLSPEASLFFVRDLWHSLEPRGSSSFEQVDRHILRIALENHYRGISDKVPSSSDPAFVSMIQTVVAAQGLPPKSASLMSNFLQRKVVSEDPSIFRFSAAKPNEANALPVLSRAMFLLRMATGAARDLLIQAGVDSAAIAFWWKALGSVRGLWQDGSEPDDLTDLWADIRECLDDIDGIVEGDPMVTSFANLARTLDLHAHAACSYERVSLWALGST